MEKSYKDYMKKGFAVIGINTDVGAMEKVPGFIRELNLSFPIILDPEHVSKRAYQVRGMPMNFLIDREGRVPKIVYGALDWSGGPARRVIENLLKDNFSKID